MNGGEWRRRKRGEQAGWPLLISPCLLIPLDHSPAWGYRAASRRRRSRENAAMPLSRTLSFLLCAPSPRCHHNDTILHKCRPLNQKIAHKEHTAHSAVPAISNLTSAIQLSPLCQTLRTHSHSHCPPSRQTDRRTSPSRIGRVGTAD